MDKNFINIWVILLLLTIIFISGCGGGGSKANSPPTVDAGSDKIVVAGTEVTLSGSVNDPDNDIAQVRWTQLLGNQVQLDNADSATAKFTAPATIVGASLKFQLEVIDNSRHTATDTILISVVEKNPNAAANAGPNRIAAVANDFSNPNISEIIFIDGSESSGSSFEWAVVSAPGNSQYTFSSDNTPSTGFYADTAGEYTLKLVANNGQGHTAVDEAVITLIDDSDGDGVADTEDLDRDGDSYLNDTDAFPDNRASHLDFDGDGQGNYEENDVDGDGIDDLEDDYPLNASLSTANTYTESTETGSFNKNDGISVAETAGSVPLKISGINYSTAGPDLDYYEVTMISGIYSVVVYGSDTDMSPSVTFINATGTTLPSTRSNFVDQPGISGVGVSVPADGDYYLIITDASGSSSSDWSYRAVIFADTDMDGISDDLEQAIDSNHLSADSDGDTIPDFVELQYAAKNWNANKDSDKDGLPNWWDMDSDGDTIPDSVEYYLSVEKSGLDTVALYVLNDVDDDGMPNFVDTSSDNTSYANDMQQAGANPTRPIDTDNDTVPNFLDLDNDNDGLTDSEETESTYNVSLLGPGAEGANVADALLLKRAQNTTKGVDNLCVSGDTLSVEIENSPASASDLQAVFNTLDGSVVQSPLSLSNGVALFTCPNNVETGLIEFYLAADGKRSDSIAMQVQSSSAPLLTSASFDNATNYVTLSGENLDAELTVNFNGNSTTAYNASGSKSEVAVYLPSGAESGFVSVTSTAGGGSNVLWLSLTRQISGMIDSPNSGVDVSSLDVSLALDEEVSPASDGTFATDASLTEPTTITALLKKSESTEKVPQYGLYLAAVVFPNQYSVTLDAESTAIALVWDGLGVDQLINQSALISVYDDISELAVIQVLTSLLKNKLEANAQVISEGDTELTDALTEALVAVSELISAPGQQLKSVSQKGVPRSISPRGLYGEDAEVTPTKADDISVYEYNDSGNIAVENDSQLYLSVKITASDGTILQNHITGLSGMAGPQGYGLLFWASTTEFKQPKGKNALVEVISPGIGSEYAPAQLPAMDVWKKLYFRTVVERVIWPLLKEALPLPASDIVDILWNNAPGVVDIVVTKALEGNVSGSVKSLVNLVWQDIASVPPGPITTALAKKLGRDAAEEVLTKIAAKIGAKFVPGVGQIQLAAEIAGIVNTGANVTKAIVDIGFTDAVIHFNVVFPLSIKTVQPSKVLPNGTDKEFKITGTGYTQIQRGWWPFESYLKPRVTITDKDNFEATATINSINADGTSMSITIPGWYLDEYTNGPLSVKILHPIDTPDAKASKADAIAIAANLELTSISPSQGGAGISATLYGVGFSTNLAENEVTIGSEKALIYSATETSLELVIPTVLDVGTHSVTARVKEDDDAWSAPSNAILYEVVQGDVSITVCDNGGLKDDAFALYVDGIYTGTMYASYSDYCDTYNPSLNVGSHSAMLLGVEAPDSIGTYSIVFNGVTGLTGSATSGRDLTPGVQKTYQFEVTAGAEANTKQKLRTTKQSLRRSYVEKMKSEAE